MHSNELTILDFEGSYEVPRGSEIAGTQERLDRIARELLSSAWENDAEAVPGPDGALYFIDSLDVELTVDLDVRDDRGVASDWARAMRRGLFRVLNRGGADVRMFRTRPEYLASYVADVLRNSARGIWYYREFERFQDQAPGRAIVSALTEDGDIGRDALMHLSRNGELERLLAALSDAEVDTVVVRCLLPSGPDVTIPGARALWASCLRPLIRRVGLTSVLSRDVARLYLNLLRERPDLGPDANLARFIHRLLLLRNIVAGHEAGGLLLRLIASGESDEALKRLEGFNERTLAADLIREIGGPETASLLGDAGPTTASGASESIPTSYGGLFLLLPAMVELDLFRFIEQSPGPGPDGMSKGGIMLLMTSSSCLGAENAKTALGDRGLAFLSGLPGPPPPSSLAEYAANLTSGMHADFTGAFRSHLRGIRTGPLRRNDGSFDEWCTAGADGMGMLNREWADAIAMVGAEVLRRFALRLGAFGDSSPAYFRRNFFELPAVLRVHPDRIGVRFPSCPLQMVLRMAGFEKDTVRVPWLRDRKLEFVYD